MFARSNRGSILYGIWPMREYRPCIEAGKREMIFGGGVIVGGTISGVERRGELKGIRFVVSK